MKQKESTHQEQLNEEKKSKLNPKTTAVFIGFLIGIIIYSVAQNSWGMVTIIPLFLIYKLVNSSKSNNPLEKS